ncbi:DegT/DnrJ/EryC1/StrS family aminotransferase [Alsobacter sp. R-9]
MAVPFYDHARLYRRDKAAIDAAIARVLESGRLDWGPEVPAFEAAFAAWVGAPHAVTTNSGTAALKVALMALGVGTGDEVVTVANTDIASASAIRLVGARPVFVDVDPQSLTMDLDAMRAAVTPRTKAILPVDLFGHPAAMPEIVAFARPRGIAVVEDACLALGAEIDGQRVGTIADITCFSFAPTKHLGSIGSGGACTTADSALAQRMQMIAAYGQSRDRHMGGAARMLLHHETLGLNERLDEIQAAVLQAKLPRVDESLAVRRRQAELYAEALAAAPVDVPQPSNRVRHAFRNYVVHVDRRDAVREALAARGIPTAVSYAPPLHLHPAFADLGCERGSLPVSERSGDRLMGLPIGPHLDDDAIAEVAAAIRAVV